MRGLTFIDQPATFEPQGDNMIMTLHSGSEALSFVIPRSIFIKSIAYGVGANRDWFAEQQAAPVVPFAKPKRRARP